MSHRRAKRLRKLFREVHGRGPNKAMWSEGPTMLPDPKRPGRFVVSHGAEVIEKDEFRQFKKARA